MSSSISTKSNKPTFNLDRVKRMINNTQISNNKTKNMFKDVNSNQNKSNNELQQSTNTMTSFINNQANSFIINKKNLSNYNNNSNYQYSSKNKDRSFQLLGDLSNSDIMSVEDSDYRRLKTNFSMLDGEIPCINDNIIINTECSQKTYNSNTNSNYNSNNNMNNYVSQNISNNNHHRLNTYTEDIDNNLMIDNFNTNPDQDHDRRLNINTYTKNHNNYNFNLNSLNTNPSNVNSNKQSCNQLNGYSTYTGYNGYTNKCAFCSLQQQTLISKSAENNKLISEVEALKVEIDLLSDANKFLYSELSSLRETLVNTKIDNTILGKNDLRIEELNRSMMLLKQENENLKVQVEFSDKQVDKYEELIKERLSDYYNTKRLGNLNISGNSILNSITNNEDKSDEEEEDNKGNKDFTQNNKYEKYENYENQSETNRNNNYSNSHNDNLIVLNKNKELSRNRNNIDKRDSSGQIIESFANQFSFKDC